MNAAIPADALSTWTAVYLAAARSPIFAALRLAAADVDALARQVADRCTCKTVKAARRTNPAARPVTRHRSGR